MHAATGTKLEIKGEIGIRLEVKLIRRCGSGFLLDCKLILKTFSIVLTANGN